jgi:hypothetical protein
LKKQFKPEFVYPIGTQVMLASGSPILTVVDFNRDISTVTVSWKDGDEVNEKDFPAVCLTLYRRTHYL